MADSAHFPAKIGGSGRSYTADANPDTGMFDGGHRRNMIPMAADMVSAAGYVSRYAQAIDGAKANADKSEDARGYVEAVADAVQLNILDQYRAKATLDLDFARGFYRVDDGTLTQTTNAADLLTVTRSTPKWVEGPDGTLREVPINAPAREWHGGQAQGARIERGSTNRFTSSNNFTGAGWSRARCDIESTTKGSFLGVDYRKLVPRINEANSYISQSYTLASSSSVVCGFVVKDIGELDGIARIQLIVNGDILETLLFDIRNGMAIGPTNLPARGLKENSDGSYTIFASLDLQQGDTINARLMVGAAGDGASGYLVGHAQLETQAALSSYIFTQNTPVNRSSDADFTMALGNRFDVSSGTIFIEYQQLLIEGSRGILSVAGGEVRLATSATGVIASGAFEASTLYTSGLTDSHRLAAIFKDDGTYTIFVDGSERASGLWSPLNNDLNLSFNLGVLSVKRLFALPLEITNAEAEKITTL